MAISTATSIAWQTSKQAAASSSLSAIFAFRSNLNKLPFSSKFPHHLLCTSTRTMASTTKTNTIKDQKITAPYGSWSSPITADAVSSAEKRLGGLAVDGSGRLLWVEYRPKEAGRTVLVREGEKIGDEPIDVTPPDFEVRTTAQEYGGQAFSVSGDIVVFSNYKDQRLYKQLIGDSFPEPLTPDYGGPVVCFADGVFVSRFNSYISVMEDHRESTLNPIATIVFVKLNNKNIQDPKILVGGNDFYAFPRMDPKGERLAWVEWSHPNMHWDKAEIWVGYVSEDGDIYKKICVCGNSGLIESPTEPKWSSRGELFLITDRNTGFWNLHKWVISYSKVENRNEVVPVYSLLAEFSKPLWVFGTSSYDFIQSDEENNLVACCYRQDGRSYLGIINDAQKSLSMLDVPFTDISTIIAGHGCFYIEGASATQPLAIGKVHLDDNNSIAVRFSIIWPSTAESTEYKSYFSVPELIKFPSEFPGQYTYAYFYPPFNPIYEASPQEKPPLVLKTHGGPTSESRGTLNLNIQYWTSRGWAFVDVNYGGSTGYGREYRERLLGRWGVVDVNDCCNCANFLVENGKVDGKRLCITGGSAGGYTTLASLAFRQTFKAGASLYGIADLASLKAEMPKFESHYIDNLMGSESAFFERSPINFVDRFSCPVILFQGLEDKIVAPAQAHKIYNALKEKGLPVALVEYEGEQHGFRKAENIKFTLEQMMLFFARLVGHFNVADEITPIKIDNFD
ncbi:hypothetical protein Scep_002039 [Stephania cephalantha]|uniref:Peptidase S9 prolyl oligopeptidase catalytic domain-containing protein n=1 Tax=Stephania cephalantha TaxID=152367 RepID=A0AAP0LAI4_9MAGN